MREAGPWPANATWGPGGLTIAGAAATDLAARYGTPLIVFDEDDVRTRMRAATAAFPRVLYAVKAFTSHAMIRLAHQEGLGLLCASGGEVEACLRAGIAAGELVLHGSAKTDDELRMAVERRLGSVVVDGDDELGRLAAQAVRAGVTQPILLRVIPEVEVHTHEAIATGHAESMFGTPLAAAPAVARRAASMPGVRLDGFHAHAGSQVLDVEPYVHVLETLAAVAAGAGVVPAVIDVGGGFGITYRDEAPLDIAALGTRLATRLAELSAANGWQALPVVQVEPGRALVGPAGCTLYTVLARKTAGGRDLVAVDGGMSDNLRPALYGAAHEVAPAGEPNPDRTVDVTVVGRHCESGDVLAPRTRLPGSIASGDLLAVAATGAYAYPLASIYNRFGRPAVVAVRDGRTQLWLRREDAADMDRLEVGAGGAGRAEAALPAGVSIRQAHPADARGFLAHWGSVAAEGRDLPSDRVTTSLAATRRRFRRSWEPDTADLLAVTGDEVIGSLGLSRERHLASRHVATFAVAVSAGWRGRGVGTALLAQAFVWAREMRVDKLVLSVYPANTAAIALYRRFGFVEEGRLSRRSRKSYGDEDEILMAAWLGADTVAPSGGNG